MTPADLLLKIQETLSGQSWTPDTLDEIAELLNSNGYPIAEVPEASPEDREEIIGEHKEDCRRSGDDWI